MTRTQPRVIAQQGPGRYLVVIDDGGARGPHYEQAVIVHPAKKTLVGPFYVQSCLARGYWEDPDAVAPTSDELAELLDGWALRYRLEQAVAEAAARAAYLDEARGWR